MLSMAVAPLGMTPFSDKRDWGRHRRRTPGLLVYLMVDRVETTINAIVVTGSEIVQPIGADAPEIKARFRDPGRNVLGLYQRPG